MLFFIKRSVREDRNQTSKTLVSNKFRKNTASWHCLLTAVHKIGKQLFQTVGLQILRFMWMHLIQQRNHNFLKNRHFIYHGGIENSIGLLLIRIDVLILSLLYILPEMNGILRTPAAKLIISGNAADQAVITCRYTVMLIQIQVRQCIDIDTKLRLFRQIGRGLRIQSVDTFYYQNMIILQHCSLPSTRAAPF